MKCSSGSLENIESVNFCKPGGVLIENITSYPAIFLYRDGKLIMDDILSPNGTFVNGHRIGDVTLKMNLV